ncbi:Glycerol-3-phosphate dehydrogenase [NAD(P)+] [Hartmannibacter diazotrophicus]|uniref:Glycerol-3-phosphate dehydrogenase [NAD(P)+] n=1 Tax=Hartmannibacter diazotrophicus TaxID=1482074 RepID=A0A2C9D0W0_9HYPH|nr:NAD(P)H-dependent glycerol-3-phosphate dehydrogenase [Hartmannibacter diazotrophicus]SON53874.1 Glycerol-3-phosphate dehydrogenase [NAD(P)+] [Hartmannibacter diazotrophicus]
MTVSLHVAVHGAGAWGTALAMVAARAGHSVTLVTRNPSIAVEINTGHRSVYLPDARLSEDIVASDDVAVLSEADVVLCAVPAQATAAEALRIGPHLKPGTPLVSCAKGIDARSGLLVSEVLAGAIAHVPIAALSGPGFAVDVAAGLPTAVTIASEEGDLAERLCQLLAGPAFRPYASRDLVGVQLGGALKNVLAIAAGIVAGARLGASAEAAVITRGFVEMRRLAGAWGAKPETLMGLAGLGDLVLTCSSLQSRNFALGHAIGAGEPLPQKLAEGVATAEIAVTRAAAFGVDVPIMAAVAAILDRRLTVEEAIDALLSRPLKREDF